jgi:hypothetical protein
MADPPLQVAAAIVLVVFGATESVEPTGHGPAVAEVLAFVKEWRRIGIPVATGLILFWKYVAFLVGPPWVSRAVDAIIGEFRDLVFKDCTLFHLNFARQHEQTGPEIRRNSRLQVRRAATRLQGMPSESFFQPTEVGPNCVSVQTGTLDEFDQCLIVLLVVAPPADQYHVERCGHASQRERVDVVGLRAFTQQSTAIRAMAGESKLLDQQLCPYLLGLRPVRVLDERFKGLGVNAVLPQ